MVRHTLDRYLSSVCLMYVCVAYLAGRGVSSDDGHRLGP